jgi:hypothetical protein
VRGGFYLPHVVLSKARIDKTAQLVRVGTGVREAPPIFDVQVMNKIVQLEVVNRRGMAANPGEALQNLLSFEVSMAMDTIMYQTSLDQMQAP